MDRFHAKYPTLSTCVAGNTISGFVSARTKQLKAEEKEREKKLKEAEAKRLKEAEVVAANATAAPRKQQLDAELERETEERKIKDAAGYSAFLLQRDSRKEVSIRDGKEHLNTTAGKANFPPHRAYTPDLYPTQLASVPKNKKISIPYPKFAYVDELVEC